MAQKKIKVLMSKVGLDGHDRGAKVVSTLLREAGMEVIYLGLYQTPEEVVSAALEEDVDVVGLSCLSGEHLSYLPKVKRLLDEQHLGDRLLIVGGVIPREDVPALKEIGVDEVFTAGTLTRAIVDYIKENHDKNRHSRQ